MKISNTYETDWLGSTPVFYNEKTAAVSSNINDVIDYRDLTIHPEGFNNYLAFGYSAFGQTPIVGVKFLPHSSILIIMEDGQLKVEQKEDTSLKYLQRETTETEALKTLNHSIRSWEERVSGDIILPLSGGFDSRVLGHFINDPSRVKAFTYGTSRNQSHSFEVINAKRLAQNLSFDWQQIELDEFLQEIPRWEKLYGPSTHAHGMYHVEFYQKIQEQFPNGAPLLSGIIGDAWAGSVNLPDIANQNNVSLLGYSHGMHADSSQSLLASQNTLRDAYFETHHHLLQDNRFKVIESMRFKMVLLSYLITVPKQFGFAAWSPFLEPDVAMSMLCLPPERRTNRQWQRDFFAHHPALQLEKHWWKDRSNTLMLDVLQKSPPLQLNTPILCDLVQPAYLQWINDTLAGASRSLKKKYLLHLCTAGFYRLPVVHSLPRRFECDPYLLGNEESRALNAYLTLHPIQTMLQMKNNYE